MAVLWVGSILEMFSVSVIIPVFNGVRFISDAIKSVQAQTCSDFEIIVVDDGSTDKTGDVVRELASEDKRIRYIYKENGGVSSARNTGLEHASGEYVSFLDCDDTYEPGFMGKCIETIGDSDWHAGGYHARYEREPDGNNRHLDGFHY